MKREIGGRWLRGRVTDQGHRGSRPRTEDGLLPEIGRRFETRVRSGSVETLLFRDSRRKKNTFSRNVQVSGQSLTSIGLN